jgi:hypothetical protein
MMMTNEAAQFGEPSTGGRNGTTGRVPFGSMNDKVDYDVDS